MALRRLIFLFLPLVVALVSCGSLRPLPGDDFQPGWHKGSLQHAGLQRVFLYYVPKNLPKNPPVVILLHGGTSSMKKIFKRNIGGTKEWPVLAEEEGFLLIAPNGTNIETGSPTGNDQNWNDCREFGPKVDDVGFISELIDWANQKANIDKNRVYVTGASNGGMMTYRLARELGNQIAAAVAFIANKPQNNECAGSAAPIPMMIVNGTEDPIMPYEGGDIIKHRGAVLSTEATVDYWVMQNGISPSPVAIDTLPNTNTTDESQIVRIQYGSDNAEAPVILYKVIGGGHSMPSIKSEIPGWAQRIIGNQNEDAEGARLAWDFLSRFSR